MGVASRDVAGAAMREAAARARTDETAIVTTDETEIARVDVVAIAARNGESHRVAVARVLIRNRAPVPFRSRERSVRRTDVVGHRHRARCREEKKARRKDPVVCQSRVRHRFRERRKLTMRDRIRIQT